MIGNDVIDLADAECHTVHPRFDERVFGADERRMIDASAAPEPMRWLLWAAKESAYKLLRQLEPETTFIPARLSVHPQREQPLDTAPEQMGPNLPQIGTLHELPGGTVRYASSCMPYRAMRKADALHVITFLPQASGSELLAMVAETRSEPPSVAVRRLAIAAIAARTAIPAEELSIVRDCRVPRIYWRGRQAPIGLSLSHHGRFVAFAASFESTRGAT